MKTIIITGSRNWTLTTRIANLPHLSLHDILDGELIDSPFDHLAQGGAKGADRLAKYWCHKNNIKCTQIDAEWDLYGKSAGMRRNRDMLEMFPDAKVLAFPLGESRGTRGCIAEAKRRGMQVVVREGIV